MRDGRQIVFTVGHSNHSLEHFLDLLTQHGVEALVDVRSSPYSRFAPHFKKEDLSSSVEARGIKYLFMGKELGGQPEGDEFYDPDGRVDYARVTRCPAFREGISGLERGVESHRVALLCSEENPEACHRKLLIGRILQKNGMSVRHIRGDGGIQTDHPATSPLWDENLQS